MSDVGSLPDLLTDLGGACASLVGVSRSASSAAAATLCDSPTERLAATAASCPPGCWPVLVTDGTSCNGDGTGTGCAPEAVQERPAVMHRSTQLEGDDGCSGVGNDDDGVGSPPQAGAASLPTAAATRRHAGRPHYGGLLYHHHFPTMTSRTKRKVLCAAAAASFASPDSLAHEGLGGGKIRVSEERVSRQLQQLRLAGAGSVNVEGSNSGGGGGVCQLSLGASASTGAAVGVATLCEAPPPAVRIVERTLDRRPGGGGGRSTSASLHPRLPKHRLYDARRMPFASLQSARRASCPGLAPPPPPGQLPSEAPSAAAIDAPLRGSPDNFGWSWTERASAPADEMDATASCRAVMLSPPLVVWQSDEKPADKSSTLGPVEPPRPLSSERRMLTLAAPDGLSRDCSHRSSNLLQPLNAEQRAQQQPTLQVPANEAERSSSPPPSALINPDEEGVCVVLTVTQCDNTVEANKLEVTDQCMEH